MSQRFIYSTSDNEALDSNLLFTGRIDSHPEPITGDDGADGTSLYFVDYDIDNDYVKESVRRKIDLNEVLTKGSSDVITGRKYIEGDLIISSSLNVYKLVKATDNNYNFDIEHLGKIRQKVVY